ncbi:Guanosine-3',5'-bis(diphosphate) 3'-pyrophosphohydrolase [compost metagenome]
MTIPTPSASKLSVTASVAQRCAAARVYADTHHGAQMYGSQRYVYHLDWVARLAAHYGLPEHHRVAAYLHDLLEDTNVTKQELEAEFGQEVADIVDSLTGEGETRAECRDSMVAKLKLRPEHAPLKLMDRLANVEAAAQEGRVDLLKMYRGEMAYYADLFENAHPDAYARLCQLLSC